MAATQVLGDALIAEATEVDHPPHALALGHAREVARAFTLAILEALATGHGVHEEVGDIDILTSAFQASGIGYVPVVKLTALCAQVLRSRGGAHETAHMKPRADERPGEAAADEPGGSSYEGALGDELRLPALHAGHARHQPSEAPLR